MQIRSVFFVMLHLFHIESPILSSKQERFAPKQVR